MEHLDTKDRLLRLNQLVGKTGILPFSRSTFYNKVKSGELPQPIKLGERISCWREADVIAYIQKMEGKANG